MSTNKIVGVIGHIDHLNTTYIPKVSIEEEIADLKGKAEFFKIDAPKSLANIIETTTANLKGKQLSARALRRAEARKLKPKYK